MANGASRGLAGLLCLELLPGCAVVESQAIVPPVKYTQVPSGIPYFPSETSLRRYRIGALQRWRPDDNRHARRSRTGPVETLCAFAGD
jgi:hypothetical protein